MTDRYKSNVYKFTYCIDCFILYRHMMEDTSWYAHSCTQCSKHISYLYNTSIFSHYLFDTLSKINLRSDVRSVDILYLNTLSAADLLKVKESFFPE